MKFIKIIALAILATVFTSCSKEKEEPQAKTKGTFEIGFESKVGAKGLTLKEKGSTDYNYQTKSGQKFNLSTFRFYLTKIKLEGPNGAKFEDVVETSTTGTKGVYLYQANKSHSSVISLKDVPGGKYNKITFTLGIPESIVKEGAVGGMLDAKNTDAWFWNWNAGYIAMGIEGMAEKSLDPNSKNKFAVHIGGWKETGKLVNNIKTITLNFDSDVNVADDVNPHAHVLVDILKVLDGANIDFSTTYSVHAPKKGQPFANQLSKAFILDHVHQNAKKKGSGHSH